MCSFFHDMQFSVKITLIHSTQNCYDLIKQKWAFSQAKLTFCYALNRCGSEKLKRRLSHSWFIRVEMNSIIWEKWVKVGARSACSLLKSNQFSAMISLLFSDRFHENVLAKIFHLSISIMMHVIPSEFPSLRECDADAAQRFLHELYQENVPISCEYKNGKKNLTHSLGAIGGAQIIRIIWPRMAVAFHRRIKRKCA